MANTRMAILSWACAGPVVLPLFLAVTDPMATAPEFAGLAAIGFLCLELGDRITP